jgi:hypothetical protein
VPAGRPTPQPADALGAARPVGRRVAVAVAVGNGRDVVAARGRCDASAEAIGGGIAVDADAVTPTNAGGVFGPDRAARGGPLHAEIAKSNPIAPAQSRRHTDTSIPG